MDKVVQYSTECSDCGIDVSVPISMTYQEQGSPGVWIRCRCHHINYARKDKGGTHAQ